MAQQCNYILRIDSVHQSTIVLRIKYTLQEVCLKHTCLPSKHRVWLPSRQTQISKHCSSRLKNKTNLRKRSWVWMVTIHWKEHKFRQVKSYSRNCCFDFVRCVCKWGVIVYLHVFISYIWSERVEVWDECWNRHDVEKERPQQVVWEMCSDNRPETHQNQKLITLSVTSQK